MPRFTKQLAKEATKTLPIVAIAVDDPVEMGLVTSIARPGGNITGISAAFFGLLAKRLQLLKDIVPAARRFAVVFNPISASPKSVADNVPRWEAGLGVTVSLVEMRGPNDFITAFASMTNERVDGVVFVADAMIRTERAKLGDLCLKRGLPSVWGGGPYLDAGGLASYQGDWPAMFRRGAVLVDKILKGTKPGEIQIEQGTKLELVVNLKGARALGITIPKSVLLSADEVIEKQARRTFLGIAFGPWFEPRSGSQEVQGVTSGGVAPSSFYTEQRPRLELPASHSRRLSAPSSRY